MAVTDEQLQSLIGFAKQAGEDGVHGYDDPDDQTIINMVFDWAESEGMRTEDEWQALIAEEDLADAQDRRDIMEAWREGDRIFERRYNEKQRQ